MHGVRQLESRAERVFSIQRPHPRIGNAVNLKQVVALQCCAGDCPGNGTITTIVVELYAGRGIHSTIIKIWNPVAFG